MAEEILAIAANFQRQYSLLFPERVPLLMCPLNEYGVMKFVCTTLKPAKLPYFDLFGWEGITSFVTDYLSPEPLEVAYTTPRCMCSPTRILQQRRGCSFDFATVLCSLLLGRGYDAYCVSGYATKQMCLADQSLVECPLLTEMMSQIGESGEDRGALLKTERETERLKELAQRPLDPWHGMWVHCWVLVLSGSRDVKENFFIDPLMGLSYPTTESSFLGIESLWNHENYWVNMQSCRNGCTDMLYDLADWSRWESVLCGDTSKLPRDPDSDEYDSDEEDEETECSEICNKAFVMPRTWVKEIIVTPQDKEARWPGGKKVTWYFKAKLERFSPYLQPDGLVTRLTTYTDLAYTQPGISKEWYKKRCDFLKEREFWNNGVNIQHFTPKRPYHLKLYMYTSPETERVMEFDTGRMDGLVRRVESKTEMREIYHNRDDFLCFRHVVFGPPDQKPPLDSCQKVLEHFCRDQSKPSNEDIKERTFLLALGHIEVTYHVDSIFPVRKTFVRKQVSNSAFILNKKSTVQMHRQHFLLKEETKMIEMVKLSKAEVLEIASSREKADSNVLLKTSPYADTKLTS